VGKLYNFLLGMVVGFGLYHATFNYHVVYASDGLHVVAKIPPRFEETYVDVRDFDTQQWLAHPELALAIEKAGKRDILKRAAKDAVNQVLEKALPQGD
jgi:hypothetical protein